MGESGAGKSTILRLLTGAYSDFDGMVLVDDIPIGNFNLHSLRSKTGILLSLQDIFHGSLFDNITLGNKSIPLSEITELADKCGLVPFVQSLPKGFDTIIDPTGKRLPGKVKQDILLLRALLGSRRLLLLEEPFIHLERKYKESLLEFLQSEVNSTIVITTSDPEVAAICDWVIKMDEGNIVAQGPWSQFQSA
jgi:ABC-type bacteriocin/lantibiotic exporter with double-glycine peptidase domain